MKFELNKFTGNFAMFCPDKESAMIFTEFLHNSGRHWMSGASYVNQRLYDEAYPYYLFNEGARCNIKVVEFRNATILYFDDFEWDDTLELKVSAEELSIQNAFLANFTR